MEMRTNQVREPNKSQGIIFIVDRCELDREQPTKPTKFPFMDKIRAKECIDESNLGDNGERLRQSPSPYCQQFSSFHSWSTSPFGNLSSNLPMVKIVLSSVAFVKLSRISLTKNEGHSTFTSGKNKPPSSFANYGDHGKLKESICFHGGQNDNHIQSGPIFGL